MNSKQSDLNVDAMADTHEVFNQTPALENINLFDTDMALQDAVRRHGGAWGEQIIREHGARCGSAEVIQWGFDANHYKPEFRTHDRYGHRTDEVRFHPAYHQLMALALDTSSCMRIPGPLPGPVPTWCAPRAATCNPRWKPAMAAR